MKTARLPLLCVCFLLTLCFSRAEAFLPPAEAAQRVEAGEAVLIDVREPAEWKEGVAEPALLLSLTDLKGERNAWRPALEQHRGKPLIVYCRSGKRSAQAAEILRREGWQVENAGGFSAWREAGLPERKPEVK